MSPEHIATMTLSELQSKYKGDLRISKSTILGADGYSAVPADTYKIEFNFDTEHRFRKMRVSKSYSTKFLGLASADQSKCLEDHGYTFAKQEEYGKKIFIGPESWVIFMVNRQGQVEDVWYGQGRCSWFDKGALPAPIAKYYLRTGMEFKRIRELIGEPSGEYRYELLGCDHHAIWKTPRQDLRVFFKNDKVAKWAVE